MRRFSDGFDATLCASAACNFTSSVLLTWLCASILLMYACVTPMRFANSDWVSRAVIRASLLRQSYRSILSNCPRTFIPFSRKYTIKKQTLTFTFFCPQPPYLLLLDFALHLAQMLALIFDNQNAPVEQFANEVREKSAM